MCKTRFMFITELMKESGFIYKEAKHKPSFYRIKHGCTELKSSSHGLWMIACKQFFVINDKRAVGEEMMPKCLYGEGQMTHREMST